MMFGLGSTRRPREHYMDGYQAPDLWLGLEADLSSMREVRRTDDRRCVLRDARSDMRGSSNAVGYGQRSASNHTTVCRPLP